MQDDLSHKVAPGVAMDVMLMIYRVAEVLAVGLEHGPESRLAAGRHRKFRVPVDWPERPASFILGESLEFSQRVEPRVAQLRRKRVCSGTA